ncbi:hypothetical protein [Nubsella zeaxanthinifaciens]|uniref:hypothetical protein n=1 Tax=Nubsella zeaxanthinifaciens TaxID=392412 RepID=UPI0018E5822C|nr:hypothetical protein [Nubsella zeaxanthinifaciens]
MNYLMRLSRQQTEHLFRTLEAILKEYQTTDLTDLLLLEMLKRIYLKLRQKLEQRPQAKYTITLATFEARGFCIWFKDYPTSTDTYLNTLINQQIGEIERLSSINFIKL